MRSHGISEICDITIHMTPKLVTENRTSNNPPTTMEFSNPFSGNRVPSTNSNAVALLCHPGIGTQRCLTHTWFSSGPNPMISQKPLVDCRARTSGFCRMFNHLSLFNADGLYRVDLTDTAFIDAQSKFFREISPQYWCLVDCNRSVPGVPYLLSQSLAFIVQAASPRSEHTDGVKKYHPGAWRYFMKNWSLAELIMG